jgi:hypothetical protein
MIFATRYGLPVEPRNFNRAYDGRISRSGLPKITVHDARRTCGSLLVNLDVHPRVAMAILRPRGFLDHHGDLQPGLPRRHPGGAAPPEREA